MPTVSQSPEAPYLQLTRRLSDLTALEEAIGILSWDQEIVMPKGAVEQRSRQIATLSVVRHERLSAPDLAALVDQLSRDHTLTDTQAANVREAHRDLVRTTRVPEALVRRWSETTVKAHDIWVEARKADDFSAFEPILTELVDLSRQRAAAIEPEAPAYDVLLDEFEPGTTQAQLEPLFADLKAFLLPMIAKVRERTQAGGLPDTSWLAEHVPADLQRAVGETVVRAMGYDFDRGRLDTSVHPFCGGAGPSDVRITTRYREDAFFGSLSGMIHETGHALYEQGRDLDLADQPVSRARSMGIHESQSLLWEKQVGLGRPFWTALLPKLQESYEFLRKVDLETFLFGISLVDLDNFIRVDADELTYPLHVIMRYEIERDLFNGKLQVADLPRVWNAKMQEYLGITPPDFRLGVLQDVHWSMGSFGYFPSYTLGALYAAQFMNSCRDQVPGVDLALSKGDVQPLLTWLRTHIHREGSRFSIDELVRRATGEPLNPRHFIDYARAKYNRLYGLTA